MTSKNQGSVWQRVWTSRSLRDYLFCSPEGHHSPVLIRPTGAIAYMPPDGVLHQYLTSGANIAYVADDADGGSPAVDKWVDTTNMHPGRGINRLINQCSHPSTNIGFGPRLDVPLTKEQRCKLQKQRRCVNVGEPMQPTVPQPAQLPTRDKCLPYCSCNTTYPKGRRRYTGVRSGKRQPSRQAHNKPLTSVDERIARRIAWNHQNERKPTVSVTDQTPDKHSAV